MARALVQQKIAKAIREAAGEKPDPTALPPGHMRLYGYYKPSLEAGDYAIETKQTVTTKDSQNLNIWNYTGPKSDPPPRKVKQQVFSVQAPQFSIDPNTISAYYPPSGHQDEARILPHVVFSDPHVPWLRKAGNSPNYPWLSGPMDAHDSSEPGRNMVPWIGLIVFEANELEVATEDTIVPQLSKIKSYDPAKLPGNGAFQMTVGDYLTNFQNRIYYEAGYKTEKSLKDWTDLRNSKDMTSVIFPTKQRLQEVYGRIDQPEILQNQKYLAHVRHVNTIGFPDAGVEEEGYFSVVLSSTTGKVGSQVPVTQIVHLISLEHYDSTLTDPSSAFPNLAETDRVGVVSLFSWTYTAIPEAVDFVHTMEEIVAHMQPLKPPLSVMQSLQDSVANQKTSALKLAAQLLHDRLNKGYTICRWRSTTGEETVAFNRGPLIPLHSPRAPSSPLTTWPEISMSSKDYQIFDKDIGIMDLTYSSAWSLGRIAAISDSPFNAALLRFRSLVWKQSSSNTRMFMNGIDPASTIMARLSSTVADATAVKPKTFEGPVARLSPSSKESVAPELSHPDVAPTFAKAVAASVDTNASAGEGEQVYSDFHLEKATNSDWELIHAWISDCLYLAHIPAHYLFPEPSHVQTQQLEKPSLSTPLPIPDLPPEALRFFYIDHAWLDCFLDGALSCANHLEPQYDSTRLRIKKVYNFYLKSNIHTLEGQSPPIPRSGFIFRSSVIKAIPDLKIAVTGRKWDSVSKSFKEDSMHDPVLRMTKMDDFTILCLLDCLPHEAHQIKFAQPPHQQRYAMGASLKPNPSGKIIPELEVRMLYTNPDLAPKGTGISAMWPNATVQPPAADQSTYYDIALRRINPDRIAQSVNKALSESNSTVANAPKMYDDAIPDSCLIGLELNDPSYQITINTPAPKDSGNFPVWTRQLWTGELDAAELSSAFAPNALLSMRQKSVSATAKAVESTPQPSPPPALKTNEKPPILPPTVRLHSSMAIPMQQSPSVPSKTIVTKAFVAGGGGVMSPQFKLICHPHYRSAPPTPIQAPGGGNIYAPKDYLPTDTVNLYDIIFAIRRIDPTSSPGYRLSELVIEIPVSDGVDAPVNGIRREPLLTAEGYKGPGVRMTSNHRFVSTLYNSKDVAQKPVLGIKLIPRSGQQDATIVLTNDGKTSEASVRLAECPVAPIVDNSKFVQVADVDDKGNGTRKSTRQPRGRCSIVLREVYTLSDGSKRTVSTDGNSTPIPLWILKKAGGDLDMNGNPV